ncbi:TetR/AcrR family transcriptional regulator [Rhodococcus spongiicola]|uniref:TetR/AcrR family transcriptional regulator n=1 Tax=Rhodococcus spongiicola TaxID=2487352 RepID=A0A3S3BPV1_9NOCA|nr:TetR/AcrR family transcriptional regulator [Rhodococcus spongiicola]RVW06375.1 TetR/AcrR family transcriptional regulator [Rhodococcus spongiicola]
MDSLLDSDRDRRRRRTRTSVLDAAEALFTERGYRQTSVEDLAKAADVAVTSVYGNFAGGKAEVYAVLGCRTARDHAARMAEVVDAAPDGAAAARAALAEYIRFHRDCPLAFRLLGLTDIADTASGHESSGADVAGRARAEIATRLGGVVDHVVRRVSRSTGDEDDARTAVLLGWASVNGILSLLQQNLIDEKTADNLLGAAVEASLSRLAQTDWSDIATR